jgi:hypothetical protein
MAEGTTVAGESGAILDCPIDPSIFGYPTVGEVLAAMLAALINEEESFSGKRPLGNSGWAWDLYGALVRGGFVAGMFDEDGYLDECDVDSADSLLVTAVKAALSGSRDGSDG